MTDLSPTSQDHAHRDFGRDTFALSATGTPIRFTPLEKSFLLALDQTHSLELAASKVGKDLEWAGKFFKRPKIYEWMTKVAQEESARQGMTVRWYRAQLLSVVRGRETWWEGECATCHVKNKTWIEPNDEKGVLTAACLACQSPVLMNLMERPVIMDRQQMTALQELGSRIDPKIERVSHEFTSDEFIFKPRDGE